MSVTTSSIDPPIKAVAAQKGFDLKHADYFLETTASSDIILDAWQWLVGPDLRVWRITKAGDALLQDPGDGSIHFLDVLLGTVEKIADSVAAFDAALSRRENAERWLMVEVVDGQAALGMRPALDNCLSYKTPPVLGGEIEPDNIELCDVAVHFGIAGQIHQQVKDLAPGTAVEAIKIEHQRKRSRWWKLW